MQAAGHTTPTKNVARDHWFVLALHLLPAQCLTFGSRTQTTFAPGDGPGANCSLSSVEADG